MTDSIHRSPDAYSSTVMSSRDHLEELGTRFEEAATCGKLRSGSVAKLALGRHAKNGLTTRNPPRTAPDCRSSV